MSETYLIRTVVEDLGHLGRTWDGTVDDATLRRGSVILRRLLVYGDLLRAWRACGFSESIHIVAPRAESFLESPERHRIEYIIAGGGLCYDVRIALVVNNIGDRPIRLPEGISPLDCTFTLNEFLASTSIYIENTHISRQDIIQYVANKLGGAHLDFGRKDKSANRYEQLDRNSARFVVRMEGHPPLSDRNVVYFELMSIGQLVVSSPDVQQFLRQAVNTVQL